MNLQQYRRFDLLLLSILAIGADVLANWLNYQFPTAGFYINFSTMIAIIALIRWKSYGVIISCILAIPATLGSDTITIQVFLYYLLSNSAVGLIPIIFKRLENTLIVTKSYWFLGYVLSFYSVLIVSRGLLGSLLSLSFTTTIIQTLTHLLLSVIISYIVLLLVKNKEGLLVDMTVYFIKEKKEIAK